MILQDRFVANVLRLIEEQQISKSELARRMEVGPAYVGNYLGMHKSPGLDVVERFARALKVSPELLLRVCEPVTN